MAETKTPSELQTSLIEEGTYLRGKIIASYAQMEFLLADLSVKLDLKFPYPIKRRISAAKEIAARPGFELYRDELIAVCDGFLEYDEMRNILAHGFMMLTTDKLGNHIFDLMMYQSEAEGRFNRLEIQTNIPRLQAGADDIVQYVQKAIKLFSRMYLEMRLEHPVEGVLTEKKGALPT